MSIVLQSSGGGSVTIAEPATASNFTQTLPAATGTVVITGTTPTLNGITFPATQVPSADANTLDDYEEGTWTPIDASGAGLSLTIRQATYVKVGKAVFVYMFVIYPSTANGSTAKIGGLPFSASSLTQTNYQLTGRNQTGGTAYNGQVGDSATVIDPVPLNSFSTGPANSVFSTYGVIFSGYYLANA